MGFEQYENPEPIVAASLFPSAEQSLWAEAVYVKLKEFENVTGLSDLPNTTLVQAEY